MHASMTMLQSLDDTLRRVRSLIGVKWSVVILLLPPSLFGAFHFGIRAGAVLIASVLTCMAAGIALRALDGKPFEWARPGSIITGLLIGLTLSGKTPFYMVIVGGFVAEYVGKLTIPWLRRNLFNPAILGRTVVAVLEVADPIPYGDEGPDIVSTASALFKEGGGAAEPQFLDVFLGFTKGAIGETSALILIIVGVLMFRYVVVKRDAAVAMLITVPVLAMGLPPTIEIIGHAPWVSDPIIYLFGGSTLLMAVFYATDPVTTPDTRFGCVLFGIGAAAIGVLGKFYTVIPGCDMYGILLMNLCTPMINRLTSAQAGVSRSTSDDASTLESRLACVTPPNGAARLVVIDQPSVLHAASSFYSSKQRVPDDKPTEPEGTTPSFAAYAESTEAFRMFDRFCKGDAEWRSALYLRVEQAGLRGCGGANFSVVKKWGFTYNREGPWYMVVNGLEGEPETFKDRYLMREYPEIVMEGIAIAAWAIEASKVYVVINSHYDVCTERMKAAIAKFNAQFADRMTFELTLVPGPDPECYVSGEETALLQYVESRRGEVRVRPPYPAESGLWGKPTLIQNVETLSWLPLILRKENLFSSYRYPKLVSLSGAVQRPGVYEVSLGTTDLKELVKRAGGLPEGRTLKAIALGGVSGGLLPPASLDTTFDQQEIARAGALLGSGSVRVFADDADIFEVVLGALRFLRTESCGRCTPCRVGTKELESFVERLALHDTQPDDFVWIHRVMATMEVASICTLGAAAPKPLLSLFRYWPEEIEQRLVPQENLAEADEPLAPEVTRETELAD